jgi:hypothetical protein
MTGAEISAWLLGRDMAASGQSVCQVLARPMSDVQAVVSHPAWESRTRLGHDTWAYWVRRGHDEYEPGPLP